MKKDTTTVIVLLTSLIPGLISLHLINNSYLRIITGANNQTNTWPSHIVVHNHVRFRFYKRNSKSTTWELKVSE